MPAPKEIIQKFYSSDFANDPDIFETYIHPECVLDWNSSGGFTKLNATDIKTFLDGVRSSFEVSRTVISHLLADGNRVTVRHTNYGRTIENPSEEIPTAHFITIWELKDNKLYRGYEISQLGEDTEESNHSYSEIKL